MSIRGSAKFENNKAQRHENSELSVAPWSTAVSVYFRAPPESTPLSTADIFPSRDISGIGGNSVREKRESRDTLAYGFHRSRNFQFRVDGDSGPAFGYSHLIAGWHRRQPRRRPGASIRRRSRPFTLPRVQPFVSPISPPSSLLKEPRGLREDEESPFAAPSSFYLGDVVTGCDIR